MFPPSLARGKFTLRRPLARPQKTGRVWPESRPPRPAGYSSSFQGPEASLSLPQAVLTDVLDQVGDPLGDLSDALVRDPTRQFVPHRFEEGVVLAVMADVQRVGAQRHVEASHSGAPGA